MFTPASWADPRIFATRRHLHLQDRVESALEEKGRQVVLFGPTGVGKTSLINYLCQERRFAMQRVECGGSYKETIREALGLVVGEHEIEAVEKESTEAEIGITLWTVLTGKAKMTAGRETKFAKYPVSLATTLAEAYRIMKVRVLFLDNFENLAAKPHFSETASEIVQLMKSLSDRSAAGGARTVKVVVAGIPSVSEQLLSRPRGRATDQTDRSAQDDPRGARRDPRERRARAPDLVRRLLPRADPLLLGRVPVLHPHACAAFGEPRRCRRPRPRQHRGLRRRARRDPRGLRAVDAEAYNRAVETSGQVQMRKSVMEAIASINEPEVPFRRIREAFLEIHPKYKNAKNLNFLSVAMKPLRDDYGILIDKGKPKSKNNTWAFANPLMRAYVNLRALSDRQQRLEFDALAESPVAPRP